MEILQKYGFIIFIIIAVVLIIIFSLNTKKSTYHKISAEEVKELIKLQTVIIDVRTKEEYESGHIENAINIPYDNINSKTINNSKDTNIIVYCRSGSRSKTAANTLIKLGYKNVYDLGSINNWNESLIK